MRSPRVTPPRSPGSLFPLLAALLVSVALGCGSATPGRAAGVLSPGDHWRQLRVDGRDRRYLVYVPPALASVSASTPVPVVLAFHGGATNAESMRRFCGLDETAERHRFIVVYAEGTGRLPRLLTWNAGDCCGYAMDQGVDDVAYTRALLDDLAGAHPIDGRRVYATGMSNGGMMCYRLAAELSDRIAAIAPVAGPLGLDPASVKPARPVSVLAVHGTADEFAPFAGGQGKGLTDTQFRSAEEGLATWVALDGCPPTPTTIALPDTERDGMRSTRTTWGPGRQGSEVALIRVEGGGHTWPGHAPRLEMLGPVTTDFDVNTVMWEFFERHPMP